MSTKKIFLLVLGAAVVLALVLGAFFLKSRPTSEPPTVRIGYLPIYVDLPLFVAKDKGYFDKRGVHVELVRFASSPDIGTALVTNNIQFGASIATAVVLSSESRDPGKLKIFIVDSETAADYLSSFVALKKSGITSLRDLKGKTVGSFPGPAAVTFGKMVLEKAKIDPSKDLKFIELDSGVHLSALESGRVDALFTYEPIATQAVLEKDAVKFLPGAVESEIMSPWQAGVWVVSSRFAEKQPSQTRSVILALYDAIDYLRSNPSEAKNSLSNYTGIKQTVAQATPNIPFAKLGEVDLDALRKQTDILFQRAIISKRVDPAMLLAPPAWTQQ